MFCKRFDDDDDDDDAKNDNDYSGECEVLFWLVCTAMGCDKERVASASYI